VIEVRLDLFVGELARVAQESALGDGVPELRHVLLEGERLGHVGQQGQLVWREVLHQPEVEERHPSAGIEEVVAGMGVAVERSEPVQTPEHEPVDRLGGEVLLDL
jgi:hypothetical protein